jgi:hypothetical protein
LERGRVLDAQVNSGARKLAGFDYLSDTPALKNATRRGT